MNHSKRQSRRTATVPSGRPLRGRRGALALLLLGLADTASGQPTDLAPSRVLLNGDPAPTGVSFGEAVAASEGFAFVAGGDLNGTLDYRAWVLESSPLGASQWTLIFNQSSPTSLPQAAKVALQGPLAYRRFDDVADGFAVQRLDLSDLQSTSGNWTEAWSPQDSQAVAQSIDASSSVFLNSRLVTIGWITGLPSHFVVLRDQDAGAAVLYSDTVIGGGPPSVSADVDQVAVGLPQAGEVITVVDGAPWVQESVLMGPAGSAGLGASGFGAAVALRNDTLAVSAPGAEVCLLPPDIGCEPSGQVWLYTRVGSIWTFATPLFSTFDVAGGEEIGRSLRFSADGTRLAVGAPGASTVFLFARDGSGNWDLLARAAPAALQETSGAGLSVAFAGSGDLFAGAPGYDNGSGSVGAALLFEELVFEDGFESGNTNAWSQTGP